MRIRSLLAAGLLIILVCALALSAKRSFTTNLEVTPDPARSGEVLAVTSSLTNTTNDVQTMTLSMQLHGPCGLAASKAYKVLLTAHETDTSKAAFQAPSCPGTYQAILTITDDRDGVVVGTSTKNFAVITKSGSGGNAGK